MNNCELLEFPDQLTFARFKDKAEARNCMIGSRMAWR